MILDLTLPGLSGLELQKQLGGRPELPIIVVTGHADVAMTAEAMKAGAVEFFTKPINVAFVARVPGSVLAVS